MKILNLAKSIAIFLNKIYQNNMDLTTFILAKSTLIYQYNKVYPFNNSESLKSTRNFYSNSLLYAENIIKYDNITSLILKINENKTDIYFSKTRYIYNKSIHGFFGLNFNSE